MYCMTYRITALQPLLFSTNAGDRNMVATSDYIPGTALLGLFANRYIVANALGDKAHENSTFSRLFLEGKVIFSNAYIAVDNDAAIPLPFSLQQVKNAVPDKVRDQIYAAEQKNEEDVQYKPIGGFGRWDGTKWLKQPVRKSLNFHHEKNRETGIPEKGIIFNYESIDAGQTFLGTITGSENDLAELRSLIDQAGATVYIGRSRNAQYGKARLEVLSCMFSCKENVEMQRLELGDGKVSLTMLSHTIIENEMGFPVTNVTELEQALNGTVCSGIKIKESFMRTGEVETFVSVWRLRKPSEACFQAGSRFLLKVDVKNGQHQKRLYDLQKNGLGRRTSEGFGRIALDCGSKKFDVTLETPKDRKSDVSPETEHEPIPKKTNEIVTSVVYSLLRKQVEVKALQEAEKFEKDTLPRSSSLIGRLEGMVKTMGSKGFQEALKSLRKTAQDHLNNCKNTKETLFNHLLHKPVNTDDISNEVKCLKCLLDETRIDINSIAIDEKLSSLYFLTFFSAMRRKIKQGRRQNAGSR